MLPLALEAALTRELADGERVMWSGQPRPWSSSRRHLGEFLFGIPLLGFVAFWEAMAFNIPKSKGAVSWFFPLWGVPFILIAVWFVLSPVRERIRSARTAYALTDRRALILEGSLSGKRTIRSYSTDRLVSLTRVEHPTGWGDLVFEEEERLVRGKGGRRIQLVPRGFLGIDSVRDVEQLVRATMKVA
jgi:hypothetical protein